MTSRPYVTSARLARLVDHLGPRDLAILRTVALVGVATGRQLERLHFASLTALSAARQRRRVLQRLHTLGLLVRLKRSVGGARAGSAGFVYTLDVAGQRLLAAGQPASARRPRPVSPVTLAHRLIVTELYVQLVELSRHDPLELICFQPEPKCWRQFTGPYGELITVKPDAFVILHTNRYEDRYFIEVDRATESAATVRHKIEVYRRYWAIGREQIRHGVFPLVLYLVPDQPRHAQLAAVIAQQPADSQRLYRIALVDQAAEVFLDAATPRC
jgi:hypothetical protein